MAATKKKHGQREKSTKYARSPKGNWPTARRQRSGKYAKAKFRAFRVFRSSIIYCLKTNSGQAVTIVLLYLRAFDTTNVFQLGVYGYFRGPQIA
jgi:hypothetical protein